MKAGTKRAVYAGAQVALLGVIVYFVWRTLAAGFTSSGFAHLRFSLPYLLASWVALLGYYLLYAGGLTLVLRLTGHPVRFLAVYKLNFATNLGKYVPGGIWPVLGRMTLGPKLGIRRSAIAASMVLEAGLSILGALVVFLASLAFGGFVPRGTAGWQWIALGAVILVALYPPLFRRAVALGFRLTKVDAEAPHLSFVATLAMVVYYAASWLVAGAAFWLYVRALVTDASGGLLLFSGFWAAAAVGGLVVVFAPGGLGVREGLLALFLAPALGPAIATVVGFSARVWSTLLELGVSGVALALPMPAVDLAEALAPEDTP